MRNAFSVRDRPGAEIADYEPDCKGFWRNPYAACTPQNCEASTAMDDAMVRDARASSEATATIYAIDGRAINFKIGTKGIDKAFVALGK